MEKADLAMAIAFAAAAFSGLQMIYTRRLARNDQKRMMKKAPLIEWDEQWPDMVHEGWDRTRIRIRNREDATLIVKGVSVRYFKAVCLPDAAYEPPEPDEFGNTTNSLGTKPRSSLPSTRKIDLSIKLGPSVGDKQSARGVKSDKELIQLITKNVKSIDEIDILWEWADGKTNNFL